MNSSVWKKRECESGEKSQHYSCCIPKPRRGMCLAAVPAGKGEDCTCAEQDTRPPITLHEARAQEELCVVSEKKKHSIETKN